MNYSILHISDIHRGPGADLNNLFESLVSDTEAYILDGITKPSFVVVSGDIAEGAKGASAEVEVRKQYREATDFLIKLTEYFLNGDKSRLIMVPGNHDVFRGVSESSMEKYIVDDSENVKYLLADTDMRWSWKDLSFYKIKDKGLYKKRFDLFVEFYNNFYEGRRSIDSNAETFSTIVDFAEYGVSFALFNSCYQLDHLRYSGAICPSSVSKLSAELRRLYKEGRLIMGVWHHHTHGLPNENNYMDYNILQSMVANNIHMGLYGHQHVSQIVNHYTDIEEEGEMLLVSSGSLYGGRQQLITGCSRQYNVIEINIENRQANITVNVREDKNPTFDIPDWGLCPLGKKHIRANYQKCIALAPLAPQDEQLFALDEHAKNTKDYDTAIRRLYKEYKSNPRYNNLLDTYLSYTTIPDEEMALILQHPNSEAQAIMLLNAVENINQKGYVSQAINESYVKNSDSPIVQELRLNLISKYNLK